MIRTFHRATQILKKYTKFTSERLRSHIKRNRYEEMLFGDDLPEPNTDDEKERPKKRQKTKHTKTKEIIREKLPTGLGNIIINTGVQPVKECECEKCKEKDCCCPEEPNKLADQDFFGLIQKLAPNLYKTLVEKAFMLDMCALDRKRMEANVCPIDCRRKAWDDLTCCERDVYMTGERAYPGRDRYGISGPERITTTGIPGGIPTGRGTQPIPIPGRRIPQPVGRRVPVSPGGPPTPIPYGMRTPSPRPGRGIRTPAPPPRGKKTPTGRKSMGTPYLPEIQPTDIRRRTETPIHNYWNVGDKSPDPGDKSPDPRDKSPDPRDKSPVPPLVPSRSPTRSPSPHGRVTPGKIRIPGPNNTDVQPSTSKNHPSQSMATGPSSS